MRWTIISDVFVEVMFLLVFIQFKSHITITINTMTESVAGTEKEILDVFPYLLLLCEVAISKNCAFMNFSYLSIRIWSIDHFFFLSTRWFDIYKFLKMDAKLLVHPFSWSRSLKLTRIVLPLFCCGISLSFFVKYSSLGYFLYMDFCAFGQMGCMLNFIVSEWCKVEGNSLIFFFFCRLFQKNLLETWKRHYPKM